MSRWGSSHDLHFTPGDDTQPPLLTVPIARKEMMPMPRKTDAMTKHVALWMLELGRPVKAVAEEMGVAAVTLYRWKQEADQKAPEDAAAPPPEPVAQEIARRNIVVEHVEHQGHTARAATMPAASGDDQVTRVLRKADAPETFEDALDEILRSQRALMISKNRDYGPQNVSVFGEKGVLVRASDKLERLKNLVWTDKAPHHESVDDTWQDLANYAVIAQMVRRGWWGLPMEGEDVNG